MSETSESASAGFVCLCVQKGVEFDIADHKLHRATKDQELHEELEKLTSNGPSEYAYLMGGGCRVVHEGSTQHAIHLASCGDSVAVFQGTLTNAAELSKAFPHSHTVTTASACVADDASRPVTAEPAAAEPAAEAACPSPAELVCIMYAAVGLEMLGLLRGKFSFCLYQAKTGRVLAARDSSGSVPLFQGMSSAESLVISSNTAFLDTCHDVKEFQPGNFKYGWYAEPRRFSTRSLNNHHHGHENKRLSGHGGSRRSLDVNSAQQPRRGSMDLSNATPQQRLQQHQAGSWRRPSTDVPSASSGSEEGWKVVVNSHSRRSMDTKRPSAGTGNAHAHAHRANGRRSIDEHRQSKPAGRKSVDSSSPASRNGRQPVAAATPASAPAGRRSEAVRAFKLDINPPAFPPPQHQNCGFAAGVAAGAADVPALIN